MTNNKKTQLKDNEVELSFVEKQQIIRTINPIKQTEQGTEIIQSDLSRLKGKNGITIFYLKSDLNKAFDAIDDKVDQLNKEAQKLFSDRNQYNNQKKTKQELLKDNNDKEKIDKLKEEISTLDSNIEEINDGIREINDQLTELSQHKEVVHLRKGKLSPEILEHMNVDEMSFLEKVIDFGDDEDEKK